MAKVTMKSIKDLFGERFFIPTYQRGYRWTETQVKELLEDLYDFVSDKKDDNDYYCLQPVIVKKKKEDEWELVDGQQRLTALWIISALYYCSNKEDVVDLHRETYDLIYEKKEKFTNLFTNIEKMLDDKSLTSLVSELEKYKTECIDGRNLIESIEYISKFSRNNKTAKGVLAQIFESINSVRIIWYVLDENEDSIQTFTNINANKIELTNAELIKAVLLNAVEDNMKMQNKALQWEDIEKGLNNNDFWSFIISTKRKNYNTRIDYLFEIYCDKHKLIEQNDNKEDRYCIFRAINKDLDICKAENIWKEIQDIYDTLKDWYNNYSFYHIIGLLIITDKGKDVKIINELYDEYSQVDKKTFRNNIIAKIRNKYFSEKKETPFSIFEEEKIKEDLEELTVQSSDKIREVLLLYNIALLVNANNTYERFPFELFKNGTWDIEHINPQTPKESTEDEKKKWLQSYKVIVQDEEIQDEIDKCIELKYENFSEVSEKIIKKLGIMDNDSISNLVLLDASTNRGYKNECFSEKRKKIIEVERTNSNDEKYIPIGTKWVFLKGYDKANQLVVWAADDMKEYVEDIATKIFEMLRGNKNE